MNVRQRALLYAALVYAAAIAAGVLIGSHVVNAQTSPPCGPRPVIVEQLARDFNEHVVSRGLASNGTMLELLVSPRGTWTMLISLPNGNSCFGAAGEMWEDLPRDPAPKDMGQPS